MFSKTSKRFLIFLFFLGLIFNPACGIKFSAVTGQGGSTVSAASSYNLQNSASLSISAMLCQGALRQERQAGGWGENSLEETVSGNQYSIKNIVAGSGQMSSSAQTIASGQVGSVSTSTAISGETGYTASISSSPQNTVVVAGGFSGQGDLKSDLESAASSGAAISGSASLLGAECFNGDIARDLSSGDSAIFIQGAYQTPKSGWGEFGMAAANLRISKQNAAIPGPAFYTGGEDVGYILGWRWAADPGIQVQVASGTVPSTIGATKAATEICKAANTWDAITHENLFKGNDQYNAPGSNSAVMTTTYTPSYSKYTTRDYKNTHAWTTDFGSNSVIIAMAITWATRDPVKPADNGDVYPQAVESDCWYNKNFKWRVASGGDALKGIFDIRTIALHELGHTVGLKDLYNDRNKAKTMYGRNDGHADWTLDQTDKLGLWQLYGNTGHGDLD